VTTITAINFALYLSFIWIEYIFHSCQNNDLLGLRSTTITNKILQEYDFGSNPERAIKPIDMFRQAVIKVKALVILAKAAKVNISKTYYSNPLFYQYFYLIGIFCYMNYLVFFWIAAHRNPLYEKEVGLNKYVCTNDEMKLNFKTVNKTCLSYLRSSYAKMFYGLNMSYLLLSIRQIHGGKKIHDSEIVNFSLLNKIKFHTFMALPLVRETTSTLEYCVKKTCLKFTDFMLLNDLKAFML
jgi:hypothetical protein